MSDAFVMRENEAKCSESQCANCKNYRGDIDCSVFKTIPFEYLGNKQECPKRIIDRQSTKTANSN